MDITQQVNWILAARETIQRKDGPPNARSLLRKREKALLAQADKLQQFASHCPGSKPAHHCLAQADFIYDVLKNEA